MGTIGTKGISSDSCFFVEAGRIAEELKQKGVIQFTSEDNETMAIKIADALDAFRAEGKTEWREFISQKLITWYVRGMTDLAIREFFPDWASVPPGEWSDYGKRLCYAEGHFIEIGLFHEPIDGDMYSGTYSLQLFDGDDVLFTAMVE